ncbi:MAG: hypothetical protein N2234_06545 [Planctomycetota bacterium]|nr:hypothetical protein [Planctomycetota bacterium]
MVEGVCPCMNPNALPRRIKVGDSEVGIAGLDEIIAAVRKLGVSDEQEIKRELIERVKRRNWVPKEVEREYAEALFKEYKEALTRKKG